MPHFLLKMICLLFPLHSLLDLTKFNSNALNSRKPSRLKTFINPSLASSKKQISPYVLTKNFVNSWKDIQEMHVLEIGRETKVCSRDLTGKLWWPWHLCFDINERTLTVQLLCAKHRAPCYTTTWKQVSLKIINNSSKLSTFTEHLSHRLF